MSRWRSTLISLSATSTLVEVSKAKVAKGEVGKGEVGKGEVGKGEVGRGEVGKMTVRYVMHLDSSTSSYPVNYVQVLEQILTRIVHTPHPTLVLTFVHQNELYLDLGIGVPEPRPSLPSVPIDQRHLPPTANQLPSGDYSPTGITCQPRAPHCLWSIGRRQV